MEQFVYLFRENVAANQSLSPEAMQAELQKWMQWADTLGQQGKLGGGEQLLPQGKVVSKQSISDGPYVEGKEIIGGYMIIHAKDLDEAVEISKGCPIFDMDGMVEVRQIQKLS